MATAIPTACLASSAIRCRDVEILESTGLTPRKMRSAREIGNATSTGSRISGLQSFVYLQAPTLARD